MVEVTNTELAEKIQRKKEKKRLKKLKALESSQDVIICEEKTKKHKKKKKKKSRCIGEELEKHLTRKETFEKVFYTVCKKTRRLDPVEIEAFRKLHKIKVFGLTTEDDETTAKPVLSFSAMKASIPDAATCLSSCSSFDRPTPIQAQCWPLLTSGRDVIGIAETGSGKTLAFGIPALLHIKERLRNPPADVSYSPMMLVIAPTRELAIQSHTVLLEAGRDCNIRSTCLYGGVAKHEQRRDLNTGCEIVVATPGRLLDLVEEGICDLSGVSYLVLDEADRMLDQGFEREIRLIISKTHCHRQTSLFSATWPDSVRQLAHEFLRSPIKVTVGSEDLAAGKNVTQIVEIVEERSRMNMLKNLLKKYHHKNNRILIFVLYKKEAVRVSENLKKSGLNCNSIHGDKTQSDRIKAVDLFKSGLVPLLIATDVAARGLDIPDVEYVINYSFPLTIEDYVHRIGRTGRAGKSGISHTFFHDGDKARAGELVNLLKSSGQKVPDGFFRYDLCVKRKQHKLYGSFGPKSYDQDDSTTDRPMKKATKIYFDD